MPTWKSQDVDRTTLSALSRKCVNVHLALPPWENRPEMTSFYQENRETAVCWSNLINVAAGSGKVFSAKFLLIQFCTRHGNMNSFASEGVMFVMPQFNEFQCCKCLHVSTLKLDEFDVLMWFRPSLLAVCLWVATTCVKKVPKVDGDFEYSYHVLSPVEKISTIEERWIPIKRSYMDLHYITLP